MPTDTETIRRIQELSDGARFHRVDLHIHSYGGSHDVNDPGMDPAGIVATAKAEGLSAIAITDHNEIGKVGDALRVGEAEGLLVVPGVELSTPECHLLAYAPNLRSLQSFFGKLDVVDRGTDRSRCQTSTLDCLRHLESVGGFALLAHVDSPADLSTSYLATAGTSETSSSRQHCSDSK